jgi:creatinine amidohydrolase
MHLCPELVHLEEAGQGASVPFDVAELGQAGVWTPRPWSRCQPDTGAGNPAQATVAKGQSYVQEIAGAIGKLLYALATAPRVP